MLKKKTQMSIFGVPVEKALPTTKTNAGLRESLLDVLDKVRNRELDANVGKAVAQISSQIINSAKLDLEYAEFFARQNKGIESLPVLKLGKE